MNNEQIAEEVGNQLHAEEQKYEAKLSQSYRHISGRFLSFVQTAENSIECFPEGQAGFPNEAVVRRAGGMNQG